MTLRDQANRASGIGPFSRAQLGVVGIAMLATGAIAFALSVPLGSAPASARPAGATFYVIGAGQGVAVGDVAPPLATDGEPLVGLDGQPLSLGVTRGQPSWVFFFATWCPPCQQETPDIRSMWRDTRNRGLAVIGIDVQEPSDVVASYASTYGLDYPIGLDTLATTMKRFSVFGLPTHYFIDATGVVQSRQFGPLTLQQMRDRVGLLGIDSAPASSPTSASTASSP